MRVSKLTPSAVNSGIGSIFKYPADSEYLHSVPGFSSQDHFTVAAHDRAVAMRTHAIVMHCCAAFACPVLGTIGTITACLGALQQC